MIKPYPAKIMRSHFYASSIRLQTQCNNQSNYHWRNSHHSYKDAKEEELCRFFSILFLIHIYF
jgi:hypothetical protein